MAVLTTPLLNKGTAFTNEEREALGLTGLLPPVISTLEAQVTCAYTQYQRLPDALGKNIYLTALHDRNEVLFFRVLSEHLREMIPIVNDRTVGLAMEQYHHECRRPRGVYLSIDHADAIEEAFGNLGAGPGDIDLILATDAEQIFGIGDWGVGGIEISIGKLAIYTAAGGIDPTRVIPVMLDVGTNREACWPIRCIRETGMRGSAASATMPSSTAYVKAAVKLFPNAVLQWEDFGPGNGRRILRKVSRPGPHLQRRSAGHRRDHAGGRGFRDAHLRNLLRNQRIVIFGAGIAGIGIADLIRDVMIDGRFVAGGSNAAVLVVDAHGLLTSDMGDRLHDYQATYARPAAEVKSWRGLGLPPTPPAQTQRHRPRRGDSPRAADHADRDVGHRGRLHGGDRERYGSPR